MMLGDLTPARRPLGSFRSANHMSEPAHTDLEKVLANTTKEKYLRTVRHTQPECLTAFRLPKRCLKP
jgi:hypothetical protein